MTAAVVWEEGATLKMGELLLTNVPRIIRTREIAVLEIHRASNHSVSGDSLCE